MNTSQTLEKKQPNYKILGWLFIGLTVFTIIFFIINYITECIFKMSDLNSLGTLISGVSGIFAALASLFFVLDNLILQRQTIEKQIESNEIQRADLALQREDIRLQIEESKKSNEYYEAQNVLMQRQRDEQTFFKLIDLNRKLFDILNKNNFSLNTLKQSIFDKSKIYIAFLEKDEFRNFEDTTLNPKYQIDSADNSRFENLEMYISNVKDVVKFIHDSLNNEHFYHNKYYNLMFPVEKYLVGMCQALDIFDFYNAVTVLSERYRYDAYYNSQESYKYTKGYVPAMKIAHTDLEPSKSLLDASSEFKLKISVLDNKYSKLVAILKVDVILFVESNKPHPDVLSTSFDEKTFLNDEFIFDYRPALMHFKTVFDNISFPELERNYIIKITFKFDYSDYIYSVSHHLSFYTSSKGLVRFGNLII